MRILYNVTVTLEPDIEQHWLEWMREIHIPEVMSTQCFMMYRMAKLIEPAPPEGVAYTVQYVAAEMSDVEKYLKVFADDLRHESAKRFGEKALAFRSIMEIIEQP